MTFRYGMVSPCAGSTVGGFTTIHAGTTQLCPFMRVEIDNNVAGKNPYIDIYLHKDPNNGFGYFEDSAIPIFHSSETPLNHLGSSTFLREMILKVAYTDEYMIVELSIQEAPSLTNSKHLMSKINYADIGATPPSASASNNIDITFGSFDMTPYYTNYDFAANGVIPGSATFTIDMVMVGEGNISKEGECSEPGC
jgi:hypothetical protein